MKLPDFLKKKTTANAEVKTPEEKKQENPENTLKVWMSDDEALAVIQSWFTAMGGTGNDKNEFSFPIKVEGRRNKNYFMGLYEPDILQYTLNANIAYDNFNFWNVAFENRIFADIKAVNPYVTSRPAEPVVYSKKVTKDKAQDDESKRLSELTQAILETVYKDLHMQQINEEMSLNRYFYKIGIIAYGLQDGKIIARNVDPTKCIFDVTARSFKAQRYFGEMTEVSLDAVLEKYPEKKDEVLKGNLATKSNWYRLNVIEWYTDEVHCVSIGTKTILELKPNPLFNFEDSDKLRYYDKAPIPYEAMNVYNDGSRIVDITGEIDQSWRLQESANFIYRQIMDNTRYVANPLKVVTGNLNEKQLSQVQKAEPGSGVLLPENTTMTYLQGAPLPAFVAEQYNRSMQAIDSIFGAQATFRWDEDTSAKSWVAKEVSRQQAAGTLAPISRAIERTMQGVYRGWLHTILVNIEDDDFFQKQIVSVLGEEQAQEFKRLLLNNPGDGVEVEVQAGSMIPDDKLYQAEQAKELYMNGKIATETAFERMGFKNPQEEADKLALEWTVNQIKANKLAQMEQMNAQNTQAAQNELGNIHKEIDSMDIGSPVEQIQEAIDALGQ